MVRRPSVTTRQPIGNDENNSQTYKIKSSDHNINKLEASNTTRSRTVLGVIPDNALNSSNNLNLNVNVNHQNYNNNHNQQYQQQAQQSQLLNHQGKNKIPVLVENTQAIARSISTSSVQISDGDENDYGTMETSHMGNKIQGYDDAEVDENEEEEEEEEEGDDDEDVEYAITNQRLSPILTTSIRNEIDRVYSKFSRDTLDPNDEDTYDVTMVAEYGNRIFNYLHSLEIKYKPDPKYIENRQEELTWDHRSTLMDWMVQLHSRFNLLPETLFLAVNIIDRFLSKKSISLSRFQLCGAVALFIAAKYEEINVPTVSQMIYMVGNQYSRESFLSAERYMVEVLGFEFGWPGPMSFLRRGSKADDYDNEIRTLAKYFLEITIMDQRFVSSPPSWLAAGAQFLSRKMLARGNWTEAHIYYTGYTSEQLIPLAEVLEDCCISSERHHRTIFQKYSERRFKRAATYVQQYLHELYNSS